MSLVSELTDTCIPGDTTETASPSSLPEATDLTLVGYRLLPALHMEKLSAQKMFAIL